MRDFSISFNGHDFVRLFTYKDTKLSACTILKDSEVGPILALSLPSPLSSGNFNIAEIRSGR